MSISDPIANMLTKLRNANMAKFEKVDIETAKLRLEITKILKNEGYIKNFKKVVLDGRNYLRIFLKYNSDADPIIHGIQRISKPGRRIYSGYKKCPESIMGTARSLFPRLLESPPARKPWKKKSAVS